MKNIAWGLLFVCFTANANIDIAAKSALVVDTANGDVIYEKNADDVKSIASITKLMTAVLVAESDADMDEQITITQEDVEHTKLRGMRTKSSIPVGMSLSRAELMHFMLMNSQNIAAAALARAHPGGYDNFVAMMNAKARLLGMSSTHFDDSCGLQPGNVSTAQDLAILTNEANKHLIIQDFSTSPSFQATGYYKNKQRNVKLNTTNRLVMAANWDVVLQKTGFTNAAGNCMVLITSLGARQVMIIVLDSAGKVHRAADVAKLRHYAEFNFPPDINDLKKLVPYKKVAKKTKKKNVKRRRS